MDNYHIWAYNHPMDLRDVRVDVFRAGLNSPVSVRVTHLPTGHSLLRQGEMEMRTRDLAIQDLALRVDPWDGLRDG